ncbi:ras-induced vulval development antagonist-domain-containing protein [Suillus cothurnatus]|nr:ras-induced vulval development antagonist-domain-containing protein [Suillus cothurnatus]
MATVHPSRMALVPQDPKDTYRRRARSPSPRTRSPPRYSERERDSGRNRAQDRSRERERDKRRDDSRHKDRGGGDDRKRDDDRRQRDKSADRGRDRERDRSRERRRGSPEYTDYKRPATPPPAEAPWRNQENLYPNRQGRDRPPHTGGSYGGGGSEYLESRRAQRDASTVSIWPPSPKAAARTLSPSRDARSRKSKRDRSPTPTDSSDSEDERRRKKRKDRKRAQKEKDRAERRERKEKKGRAPSRHRSYDSAEEDRERSRRSKSKSHPRSPSPSRTPSPPHASEEDEWVEKPAAAPFASSSSVGQSLGSMPPPTTIPLRSGEAMDEDSDEDVGPQPLHKVVMKKFDERAYGSALLRGEGSAMAAFLQDDTDTRIPRRGEIGLTSDEIAQFESVGYVMSGSRHKRMNAVRMRKENQVISAEEKRGILKLQKDERQRREAILREEFSELVTEKLKGPPVQPK